MMKRIEELVRTLNEASEAYYNGERELMSNYEWDALFDELLQLEKDTGIILPDSPTQKSGAKPLSNEEEHEFPARSLDKTKSIKDAEKWADSREIWISWKLDGLTLVATYDDGKLTKLLTRGNGFIGTNVTHLAPVIHGLPLEINIKGHVVVRGEALISYEDFHRVNEKYHNKYDNARNLASGSMNLHDREEFCNRNIQFVVFRLVYTEKNINSWRKRMELLQNAGFKTVEAEFIENPTEEEILKAVESFKQKVQSFDFPVDGLVLCYEDNAFSESGPATEHHAKREGYAFKWEDETKETVITGIHYETSRTGIITQVAEFEPVRLCGTTISKATIPNHSYRTKKDLKIGDRISVFKANMIIPTIAKNLDESIAFAFDKEDEKHWERYNLPKNCPCCQAPSKIDVSKSGVQNLICDNPNCIAKRIKAFVHFCEKDCMDIRGLSEAKMKELVYGGYVTQFADFYKIVREYNQNKDIVNNQNESLKEREGWGETSVKNMISAINASRKTDFVSFLHAMGIPNVGKGQAKLLKQHLDEIYPDYEESLINDLGNDGSYDLMGLLYLLEVNYDYNFQIINGFGEVINESLKNWIDYYLVEPNPAEINSLSPQAEVICLLDELTFTDKPKEKEKSEALLQGKTFVVTGEVHNFKNRKELQEKIESLGGKVTGSVTSKTNYLINNDVTSTSGKNKKAKELNIPVISEEEFLRMIQ